MWQASEEEEERVKRESVEGTIALRALSRFIPLPPLSSIITIAVAGEISFQYKSVSNPHLFASTLT